MSVEDWLITQTSGSQPRRKIARLMLDGEHNKVDFGASTVRTPRPGIVAP